MPKTCIAIPIYKNKLSEFEKYSLNQCVKVLGDFPIYFFEPKNLDSSPIREGFPKIKVKKFEDKFFNSLFSYNELMLSNFFYSAFREYDYMLLYQLDAFVSKMNYYTGAIKTTTT